MRRWLLPGLLAVAGLAVWFAPTDRTLTVTDGAVTTHYSVDCRSAPGDLLEFGTGGESGGWFVYGSDEGPAANVSAPCRPAAWWRFTIGSLLLVAVVVAANRTRNGPEAVASGPSAESG